MCNCDTPEISIDVRLIPPRIRHPLIFDAFGRLTPGEGIVLVNDHDPKPLLHQLQTAFPGLIGWSYREQGPDVWQVRISRLAA